MFKGSRFYEKGFISQFSCVLSWWREFSPALILMLGLEDHLNQKVPYVQIFSQFHHWQSDRDPCKSCIQVSLCIPQNVHFLAHTRANKWGVRSVIELLFSHLSVQNSVLAPLPTLITIVTENETLAFACKEIEDSAQGLSGLVFYNHGHPILQFLWLATFSHAIKQWSSLAYFHPQHKKLRQILSITLRDQVFIPIARYTTTKVSAYLTSTNLPTLDITISFPP